MQVPKAVFGRHQLWLLQGLVINVNNASFCLKIFHRQTPAKTNHSSFTTDKLAIVQAQQLVHLAFREISALASLVLITVH